MDDAAHGVQLAAAVILAFISSSLLGLSESFWAVMSALIVVRPHTGGTMTAGWDRVRGTLAGTACGLGGVWLLHLTGAAHLGVQTATLLVVAGLAFGSAILPAFRSAPITALIVLTSGGIAGHSVLQVAALRVLEIALGVAAGLLVTHLIPGSGTAARFQDELARVLRRIAAPLQRLATESPDIAEANAEKADDAAEIRAALRHLAILAEGADHAPALFRSRAKAESTTADRYRRMARLTMRLSQDATVLMRALGARMLSPEQTAERAAEAVAVLEEAAAAISNMAVSDTAAQEELPRRARKPIVVLGADGALMIDPLRMLRTDLAVLMRMHKSETRA